MTTCQKANHPHRAAAKPKSHVPSASTTGFSHTVSGLRWRSSFVGEGAPSSPDIAASVEGKERRERGTQKLCYRARAGAVICPSGQASMTVFTHHNVLHDHGDQGHSET